MTCSALLQAQLLNKDSLLRLLPRAKDDTQKVYLLFSLSDQYETSEPEKAKYFAGQAGELSRKLNFETGIFKHYRYMSFINAYQSRYDSVLYYNQSLLELAKNKKDTFTIGVCLFNIGEAYKFKSDYENGLQYTLEAVNMLQGKGYDNIESSLYGGLQGTYLMLKQYEKAIEFGVKAVETGRKLTDKNPLISALTNLANCYGEMGKLLEAKQLYNEAINLLEILLARSPSAPARLVPRRGRPRKFTAPSRPITEPYSGPRAQDGRTVRLTRESVGRGSPCRARPDGTWEVSAWRRPIRFVVMVRSEAVSRPGCYRWVTAVDDRGLLGAVHALASRCGGRGRS